MNLYFKGSPNSGVIFDLDKKRSRIKEIDRLGEDPAFWGDQKRAKALLQEKKRLETIIHDIEMLERRSSDAKTLIDLAVEEGDEGLLSEASGLIMSLEEDVQKESVKQLLSRPEDQNPAILTIHSGAGGTEACDWAAMLSRMYKRWSEQHGYTVEVIDYLAGEEAGVKSVTFLVTGPYAFGYLKAERGIHRLVRISPFDSNKRRHTSFASVDVIPEAEENIEIELEEKDLRIDVYRASGPGGQGVNTTDSAVRVTHLPTGIVAQCQSGRSQLQNKERALQVLKARLNEKLKNEREAELAKKQGEKKDISWGSQIRSYTLQPYRLVKDHRTGIESGNPDAVLDGDIDQFIDAFLLQNIQRGV